MSKHIDIAVIGGGPAGMMAAGRAAELGKRVVLIEKNTRLGRKLLMTGGGRCNLTHAEYDIDAMVGRYGRPGRFLYHAFSVFGVDETFEFFLNRGVRLKVEPDGRVFPESDRTMDVLKALEGWLSAGRVTVATGVAVNGLEAENGVVVCALTSTGPVEADSFIVCAGGRSYPATGSTGECFGWIKGLGHTVTRLTPLLTPITVKEGWVSSAEGASFRGAEVSVWQDGKKKVSAVGDGVFTRNGLSGPIILDLSGYVGELAVKGEVKIRLDLMPGADCKSLDARLLGIFRQTPNRLVRNIMEDLVVPKLAPVVLEVTGVDPDRQANKVTREERGKILGAVKGLTLTVKGLGGFERAMVTGGGVSLREVAPKTMRSKLVGNLYFAGETLDITGPTGGYNLQISWSTGYLAGESAANIAKAAK